MDSNDKWVWADETDSSPLTLPLLDQKLTPIVEWPDVQPEPPVAAVIAEPSDSKVEEAPAPPPVSKVKVEEAPAPPSVSKVEKAPAPPSVSASVSEPPAPAPETPPVNGRRDISATVVRATVLHLEGQIEQAIQEIQNGLRNGEPEAELYATLAALQMDLERFEEAAASCREALKREPDNQTCQHNLALCLEKLNAPKKPPKPAPSLVKAIVLHMEGKIEEAIKELQRGVKAGEKTADVYAGLGHLQFEAGRFDAAADAYREVLVQAPLHKTCHYNLAVCLEKTGRYKEALSSFQKAFEINSQRVEIGIGVGVSLLHLRRFAEAETAFDTCLKGHPSDETALFGKAFAQQGQGRHAEAEAAYADALKRNPAQEEALLNLIALSVEQKKDAATREYCEKLLSIRPESKVALETLMALHLASGDYEAACLAGEQLTRIVPDGFEAWFNFGVACRGAKRGEPAVAAFSKATRIRPKSFEAQSSLGAALQEQGDLAKAKAAYEAALKISPDHPAVLWNLVLTAEQSGDAGEAERMCATLASKSTQSDAVLFRLGSLRFQRGDYLGSSEAFRSCLKKRPDWPAAQLNLGLALWKSGNRDEARQKLEGVNGSYGSEALHSLAIIAAEREDYQQALGYYKKLVDAGERTPELFYNTGLILQNLGRPEEAAQQYREALAVKPDLAEATQALAQVSKAPAKVEEIRKSVRKESVPGPRLLKSR
jgi:tetratricopeptide (TPR) repeat protein